MIRSFPPMHRVSFVRCVLAGLVLLFCSFSARSECVWTWTGSGWNVKCDFSEFFVPGSVSGACTNCVQMTPEVCEAIKTQIEGLKDQIYIDVGNMVESVSNLRSQIGNIQNDVRAIQSEGEGLVKYDSLSDLGPDYPSRIQTALSTPQAPYLQTVTSVSGGLTDAMAVYQYVGGINAIANYYANAVAPYIQDVSFQLTQANSSVDQVESSVNDIQSTVGSIQEETVKINCSVCTDTSGLQPGVTDPSGPPTTSGCPCKDFILGIQRELESLHADMNQIFEKVSTIQLTLTNIKSDTSSIISVLGEIKTDVHKISGVTEHMDDFFKEDTSYGFKALNEHLLTLSNVVVDAGLKLEPVKFWEDYTNATDFTTEDGSSIDWLSKGRQINTSNLDTLIDFGEYSTLNWLQRMEFLLGRLAGVFDSTNSFPNADFSSGDKAQIQQVEGDSAWSEQNYDSPKTLVSGFISKIESTREKINPFRGLFASASGSSRTITLLPDVSIAEGTLLPDSTFPAVTLDLSSSGNGPYSMWDVIELCHSLTTFLSFVLLLLFNVTAIYYFVRSLIKINRWYWDVYHSWVATMFNGAGR